MVEATMLAQFEEKFDNQEQVFEKKIEDQEKTIQFLTNAVAELKEERLVC